MDVGSALDRLRKKDRRLLGRARAVWLIAALLVLLFVAIPPACGLIGEWFMAAGNVQAGAKAALFGEVFQDPKRARARYDDVLHLMFSGVSLGSKPLDPTWCSAYLLRSGDWMPVPYALHDELRRGRIMCYDVTGSRADALAEARVYADEHGAALVRFSPSDYRKPGRSGAYLGLVLTASTQGRYALADDLIAEAARFPVRAGLSVQEFFSPRMALHASATSRASQRQRCARETPSHNSTATYLCVRRGLLPRTALSPLALTP